jgi:hypothetical protein
MPEQPHAFSKLADELVGDLRGIGSPATPTHTIGGWRRRPKSRATQSLADLIESVLQENRIGRSSPEQTIRDHWLEIVGATNASYSHPARIERNQVVVLAAHAVVRNELFHHRAEIVSRIQKLPGCSAVKLLNLRAG